MERVTGPSYLPQARTLVGTWRRFGVIGPVHEIVGGDCLMRVRLVETGEGVDDRFTEILNDPREH